MGWKGRRGGVQYAAGVYTQMLKDNGITISMSRKGNPWDNAACESFMKTLKHEEVNRTEYRNLADARTRIGRFLESIYDDTRMHSSLEYRSPNEFESSLTTGLAEKEAAWVFQAWAIYRSDVWKNQQGHRSAPAHRPR